MLTRIRALSLGCLIAFSLSGCDDAGGVGRGERAPSLSGEDVNGLPISLSQYQGRVVLVDFWFTRCGPCISEIPHEIDLYRKYGGRPFAILGVSHDAERSDLKEFLERTNLPWPNIFDAGGSICKQWKVTGFPTVVLVDGDGMIRGRWSGSGQSKQIEAMVAKLVAEAEKKAGKSVARTD